MNCRDSIVYHTEQKMSNSKEIDKLNPRGISVGFKNPAQLNYIIL